MAIPENQLDTWSHRGSVQQSATTYGTIKRALENANAGHSNRNFKVFLQGSYGNETNIFAESDVDIVICFEDSFFHNADELPSDHQTLFHSIFPAGDYTYDAFKGHVLLALQTAFPRSIQAGTKAIKIAADGARRSADVVVAFRYRHYDQFAARSDQSRDPGIAFFNSRDERIVNFPEQHAKNLTAKHQATGGNFKPVIRVFKNLRTKLVEDGAIATGVAPSYFIEGLLYNVPNDKFRGAYSQMVRNILSWLDETKGKSEFLCGNEHFYLLRDNANECWPIANGALFISEAIRLWDEW